MRAWVGERLEAVRERWKIQRILRLRGRIARRLGLGPGYRAIAHLPLYAFGFELAPSATRWLARYRRELHARAAESSVFSDVATLLDWLVAEDLICQVARETKTGVSADYQFVGSPSFYARLRQTRYANVRAHPAGRISMADFIVVDELVHECLHLLFYANEARAGIRPDHFRVAEELSVCWWQGVIHNKLFPEWINDRHIFEVNHDFLFDQRHEDAWLFWDRSNVYTQYGWFPWIPRALATLPARPVYIGDRADLDDLRACIARHPTGAFLARRDPSDLVIGLPFESYPPVPAELRLMPDTANAA